MKKLFFSASSLSPYSLSTVSLVLRLMVGGAMLSHGIPKLLTFGVLSATFPDPLRIGSFISLALAVGAEVGCSLLLIFGLFTRLAILPLFSTMAMAFFVIHGTDPFAAKELAMTYMAIYIAIFAFGAGHFSLDHFIFKQR